MPIVRGGELVAMQNEEWVPSSQRVSAPAAPVSAVLPSSTTAMEAASGYDRRANSALSAAAGNARALAGVGGALKSQGQSLTSQYWGTFAPLVNQLPGMATIPLQSYVDEAANAVASNYDRERGMMRRDVARMGVNPASGRMAGMMESLARAEAAARAGAMTSARFAGQRENFQRALQASNLGMGIMGAGQGALQAAGSAYGGAMQGQMAVGNAYSARANEASAYAAYQDRLAQPQAALPAAGGAADALGQAAAPTAPAASAPYYLSNQPGAAYMPSVPSAPAVSAAMARWAPSVSDSAPRYLSNAPGDGYLSDDILDIFGGYN